MVAFCDLCYANVLCVPLPADMASSVCSTGEARLTGGAESFKGKVEVCINGHWGAICSEGGWGYQGATVVCKQLGFNSGQCGALLFSNYI